MQNFNCIIAVGCSHTFGYEHQSTQKGTRPSSDTWIDHIGNKLGLPVFNFSQPGASNQTILRRLIIAMEFARKDDRRPLFILQWTRPERYETYMEETINYAEDWPWLKPSSEINGKSNSPQLKKWSEDFYKLYDDKALMFESLKCIHHANLILKSASFLAVNCLGEGWDLEEFEFKRLSGFVSSSSIANDSVYSNTLRQWYIENGYKKDESLLQNYKVEAYENNEKPAWRDNIIFEILWDQISDNNWWLYNKGFNYGLLDFCVDNNLEIGPEGHAMENAHAAVFKFLDQNDRFLNILPL